MSVVTAQASLALPAGSGKPFSQVDLEFHKLRRAGRELFQYLWRITDFGTREVRLTDREIAGALGKSLRWVQKALRQLLGHASDLGDDPRADPPVEREPRIAKRFAKGAREVAGRVIRIVVDFARPKEKEKDADSAAARKPRTSPKAPAPAPPLPPPPAEPAPRLEPTSPEAAAWLKGQLEAMKAPASPPKSEEELARRQAELDEQLEHLRRRRTSADPGTPPQRAGP